MIEANRYRTREFGYSMLAERSRRVATVAAA